MYRRLKLTFCPGCKAVGTLILHGTLLGYSENDDNHKSCRGRRIFCNNRKRRNKGCGRSFSVRNADTIKRLRLSAGSLWAFFKLVVCLGKTAQALRTAKLELSISSAYRIWKRFQSGQSHLRSALAELCSPPELPDVQHSEAQTIAHLKAAFPRERSPIAAFQHQLQITFL